MSDEYEIRELDTSDGDIAIAYDVINDLRTHLSPEQFASRYREMYADVSYRIVALFADGECRAVAGFRWILNLAYGDSLYVDDLVTRGEWRSKGYGATLIEHLTDLARAAGAASIRLDSATHRADAHRFYEREGFVFTSKHFVRAL